MKPKTHARKTPESTSQGTSGDHSGRTIDVAAQPGDILLFTRAEGMNRLITWFTQSRYYHVALYEGDDCVVEARPRGVVRRDLNGPDGDKSFVVIPAPQDKGRAALQWAQQRIGDGYDPVNVFSIIIARLFICVKPNFSLEHRFSCGEFVTEAFRAAGADLFPDRTPEEIVPADFEKFLPPRKRTP